jgi:phosphohistidine phosphatase
VPVQLIFFRHGPAGSKSEWQGTDAERPLTGDGRTVVQQAAALLSRAGVAVDAVLSSPLARAHQTAEIAASTLGCPDRLADDERLAHGFDRKRLAAIVAEHSGAQSLMLVGHEPEFSAVIGQLTGGTVVVKKAGVARVDLDEQTMRGTLVWLLPPRVFGPER